MDSSTISNIIIAFLENLPTVLKLGEEGIAYVAQAVLDFKALIANPNTTQADIDSTVAAIQARSAQIQALS